MIIIFVNQSINQPTNQPTNQSIKKLEKNMISIFFLVLVF